MKAKIEATAAATTITLTIGLESTANQRQEVELLVPVPDGVAVRACDPVGSPARPETPLLSGDTARKRILDLLTRSRDPAPVEFLGYDLIQVAPTVLEPRAKTQVCVVYDLPVALANNRLDIVLPRTESLQYQVPWDIAAAIDLEQPISTVYSPSHEISMRHENEHRVSVSNTSSSRLTPGPFRLTVLTEAGDLSATVFAYPDKTLAGGCFLLLVGLPEKTAADVIPRELTLVLDRSGSMAGRKVEQVKQAAAQVISALQDSEAFNLITYNHVINHFSSEPLPKTPQNETAARQFISTIIGDGWTDIHEALSQALSQKPVEGMLPLILFLTDGLPTWGQTNEIAIRDLVVQSNPYNRRVYTFGVGYDLNAPLLNALATLSKGRSTFILPEQDVDGVMAEVFANLSGAVIVNPEVRVLSKDGTEAAGRVLEILPLVLPDVFQNDQLVLLGRYLGREPLVFELNGDTPQGRCSLAIPFDPNTATTENSFVPILWASRIIGALLDEVMQLAAEPDFSLYDSRFTSLVFMMVNISIQFGIVTEYTSFLAQQDTDLADYMTLVIQTMTELYDRSTSRSGIGAVNQSINLNALRCRSVLNPDNRYLDRNMRETKTLNAQHIHDLTFYFHKDAWIDSRLVAPGLELSEDTPVYTIAFGGDDYVALADRLAAQNRQGAMSLGPNVILPDRDGLAVIEMPPTTGVSIPAGPPSP